MAALTIGLVGCNDEPTFFPTSDSGTTDTGGGDTGGRDTGTTTDTGGSDMGTTEIGIPDVAPPEDTGGTDTAPTDAGPDDTGTPEIPPAVRASLEAYCDALVGCGIGEEECHENIEYYAAQFIEEYGMDCMVAYAAYFDCIAENAECEDGELYSDACGDEYTAAETVCEID
jgi:hypothetical protein